MQFIVKAVSRTGEVRWLTVRNAKGERALGPLWMAAVFETDAEVRMVIAKLAEMPYAADWSDVVFTVQQQR
jgi:hypothetical protein